MTFNDIHGCAGCLLVNTDKCVSLFFDMTKSREDIQKAKGLFAHVICAVTIMHCVVYKCMSVST